MAVSAPGYARVVSPGFDVQGDERSVVFDVALQREAGLLGRVVDDQGQPVLGATVKVVKPGTFPSVINGRLIYGREGADRTQSAEDGGFWLPAPGHEYLLLVLHDRGIARVPQSAFRRSSEIRLEPWSQIEGTVWRGGDPAANAAVRGNTLAEGYRDGRAWIEVFYEVTTDAEGRFSLDRVAPGKLILGRVVNDVENGTSSTVSNARPTMVAGEVRTLKIGGVGRPVRGRIARPADLPQPPDGSRWELAVQLEPDEGPASKALGDRRLFDGIGDDGAFAFDDVPAGAYTLMYTFGETQRGWFSRETLTYFRVSHRVVVPEMPGGVSDEPLELGEVEGEAVRENWPAAEPVAAE